MSGIWAAVKATTLQAVVVAVAGVEVVEVPARRADDDHVLARHGRPLAGRVPPALVVRRLRAWAVDHTISVPASPASGALDLLHVADDAPLAGRPVKLERRPAPWAPWSRPGTGPRPGGAPVRPREFGRSSRWSGFPQSTETPGTSEAMTKASARISAASTELARSLSMTASTPRNLRSLRITGMPAAAAADDDETHLDQLLDLAVLDDRERLRAGHHPPEALVGLDHGVGQAPWPAPRCRRGRSAWWGSGRPGRSASTTT